jgi:hypothetical protein
LIYDAGVLSIPEGDESRVATGALLAGFALGVNVDSPGEVRISAAGIGAGVNGAGTAFEIAFDVVGSGGQCTDLNLSGGIFENSTGGAICVEARIDGGFCVAGMNQPPTLGEYAPIAVKRGELGMAVPSTPPADPDDGVASVEVSPTVLPGGGSVAVNAADGVVTVAPSATAALGPHSLTVTATDTIGASVARELTATVLSGVPGDEDNDGAVSQAEMDAAVAAYRQLGPIPPTADTGPPVGVDLKELTAVLLQFRGL